MVLCNDLVSLSNSIDFLKIYDGKRPYYGGTQSWFKNSVLRKAGCSIVAAANITAYIAKSMKNKILYNYEDMSKDNFLEHMESISKFIHPDEVKGVTSISYFDNEVIDFSKAKGVDMKAHMITTEDNFENVKYFIKEALSENKPVALLMLKNNVLQEFDWHWMTVTKLFENMDKTYVDISTWGERRIFTLEDFYKYSSFGALSYFEPERLSC
ncbi:MAG: hypothetical protein Q4F66_09515 [Clostridium sp.]|nr:hypothetical protein [Clostridium sp.]